MTPFSVEAWFNQDYTRVFLPIFERQPYDHRDPYLITRALKKRYEAARREWDAVQVELEKVFGE